MPQSEVFTSLRAALETTRGTGVNPVRILESTDFDHTPDVKTIRPKERRGSFFAFYRSAVGREKHAISFGGNLTYNQLAWLGQVFVKGGVTGTGAGADKTYAYVPSSATDDLKSVTFEFGYDTALSGTQPGFRLVYGVGDELEITFDKAADEGVTFKTGFHSPKAIAQLSAFGGTPSALASTAISPVQTQVYIDPTTIGTTVDNYVTKAVWKLNHGWTDLDTLNATTAAQDTFRVGERGWTLELTRYGINDNELDRYYDKAVRKIRILSTGPVLGGSNYKATLDLYGVLDTDGHKVGISDGLAFETLKYVPVYDATAVTDHSLTCVTAEVTIT